MPVTENIPFQAIGLWVVIALLFLDVYLRWKQTDIAKSSANAAASRDGQPTEITPQPLIVKSADEFATRKELERLDAEFKHHVEHEAKEASSRRQLIYNKIDNSNADLTTKMDDNRKELEDKIKDVHNRVDTIPDRIITTLRNTGAIKP